MPERDHLSIGEVLALLRDEFPDVTISKIRFLESQGLVDPERTPSGYRKFYDHDVERLRWILLQQREKFLPLKVIKVKLAQQADDTEEITRDQLGVDQPSELDGDAGLAAPQSGQGADQERVPEPFLTEVGTGALAGAGVDERQEVERAASASTPSLFAGIRRELDERAAADPPGEPDPPTGRPRRQGTTGPGATGPAPVSTASATADDPARRDRANREPRREVAGNGPGDEGETYTVEELARVSGAPLALVEELRQYGLINAESTVAGTQYFDESALSVARAATALSVHGVEARHLRVWRNSADREADLYHQIVLPLLRQRNPQARSEALETLDELTRAGSLLREALLRKALREIK
jgi:DNA-binding transcriptional MerR regulator